MTSYPIINGASTKLRVLAAIRQWFRENGFPPSHGEIGRLAGIASKRVQRYVEMLADDGYLTFRPREPRSIQLVDRAAMLSDAELRLANAGRGWTVTESVMPALATSFVVDITAKDPDADLLEQLSAIPGGGGKLGTAAA